MVPQNHYMWIYLSGSDGLPGIVLYDYRPGRGGENPTEFLSGFKGLLHCDGYSAYGRIEDVVLVCAWHTAAGSFMKMSRQDVGKS